MADLSIEDIKRRLLAAREASSRVEAPQKPIEKTHIKTERIVNVTREELILKTVLDSNTSIESMVRALGEINTRDSMLADAELAIIASIQKYLDGVNNG